MDINKGGWAAMNVPCMGDAAGVTINQLQDPPDSFPCSTRWERTVTTGLTDNLSPVNERVLFVRLFCSPVLLILLADCIWQSVLKNDVQR